MELVDGTFLTFLDERESEALKALGVVRGFPRGTTLMLEHESSERVMILLSGRVKVARVDDDGREVLLSIRDPGDVLGELGFIDGLPRIATVTALEPVFALVISAPTFRTHLETTPRVAVALLRVMTRRFRETTVKLSQFAASDTLGRVAARILELCERYGDRQPEGVEVQTPLSQEELAAWVGASRAGVAQALQTLRGLGWIRTERRLILVTNVDALRRRAADGAP